jgi:hypothetical protein
MKTRVVLLIILIAFGSRVMGQPPETIYQGTLIHSGYVNDASYGPFDIGFNLPISELLTASFMPIPTARYYSAPDQQAELTLLYQTVLCRIIL